MPVHSKNKHINDDIFIFVKYVGSENLLMRIVEQKPDTKNKYCDFSYKTVNRGRDEADKMDNRLCVMYVNYTCNSN